MKKVLIVIQDMESGGAQKSLLSFLKNLEKKNIGKCIILTSSWRNLQERS